MLQGVWKTNLMKSKIDINFRAKMLLWQLKYDSLPSFFFSFLVFSGGSILYTNLVVMIRSLGTSLRVGVFSHSKPHLVHVLKFTSHFTNQSLKNHNHHKHLENSYMPCQQADVSSWASRLTTSLWSALCINTYVQVQCVLAVSQCTFAAHYI